MYHSSHSGSADMVKWFTRCNCQRLPQSKHNPAAHKLMIALWRWFREIAFSFWSSSNTNNCLIFFNTILCFSLISPSRIIAIDLKKSQSKQFLFIFPYIQLHFCNRTTGYTARLSISALWYWSCHTKTCKCLLMLLSHTVKCVFCGGFIFKKKTKKTQNQTL